MKPNRDRFMFYTCVVTVLVLSASSLLTAGEPRHPFPQHVAYATGTIHPDYRSQAEQNDDVRAFYEYWQARYLIAAGVNQAGNLLYRVSLGSADPTTVSEGQGYGMVIVALMAGYDPRAQVRFDGLWEFARANPSNIDPRLMAWKVPPDPGGNDSAFDGDVDMAYALLLADTQWGSDGRIDYKAEAAHVLAAILESTIGPTSRLPLLGDWVDPDGRTYNQYTVRSSDLMPAHFRAFARFSEDPTWEVVLARSQAVISSLQADVAPNTGLLPDFIVSTSSTDPTPKPAPPGFLEDENDDSYYYNAGRSPWRIGTDALLNGDPTSFAQSRKISAWAQAATNGDPADINAGYTLDGAPLRSGDYFSTFFAAPLGVAAMTVAEQQAWLNAINDAIRTTHEDYYEDSVTLLCLLVMTGNYWDPTTIAQQDP